MYKTKYVIQWYDDRPGKLTWVDTMTKQNRDEAVRYADKLARDTETRTRVVEREG